MSNHFHLTLTDTKGCLPDLMEYLDSLLARALNALHGTTGTVMWTADRDFGRYPWLSTRNPLID
jgi:hypothetical protein